MPIIEQTLTITNKLGLHARAATKLAQLSQNFSSKVTVKLENKEADASSIMALMLLAGGKGKQVTVTADGPDANDAIASISQLITAKFDEDE
jgi:phosphocarrier protein NPr